MASCDVTACECTFLLVAQDIPACHLDYFPTDMERMF